jgi:N-acetylated-alpha-linked acidic dipeptidase
MAEIAQTVIDPQTKVSIYERKKADDVLKANSTKAKKDLWQQQQLTISALGSGSDYSSFLQHLGVPSLNLGFGGEDEGGDYHSIFDSWDHYRRFGDPGFQYGVALAQTAGRAALRLADAPVLPFNFINLQKTISKYVSELDALVTSMRENTALENELIRAHQYDLATDPQEKVAAPAVKPEVPYIDFSPLQNALVALDSAAHRANFAAAHSTDTAAVNQALYQAEQQLLAPGGLPRRDWYKHTIYAPGFYTGYGVKTLPGVREAIEQRNWKEAQEQIGVTAAAITRLADYLDKIK